MMRGFPSKSVGTGAKELSPALMQGELDWSRKLPFERSKNTGRQ